MLKSYEAVIENGHITWLAEQPQLVAARVIVTVLEEGLEENAAPQFKRRSPPASISGKGKTFGDIVSPIVEEKDWECLK